MIALRLCFPVSACCLANQCRFLHAGGGPLFSFVEEVEHSRRCDAPFPSWSYDHTTRLYPPSSKMFTSLDTTHDQQLTRGTGTFEKP